MQRKRWGLVLAPLLCAALAAAETCYVSDAPNQTSCGDPTTICTLVVIINGQSQGVTGHCTDSPSKDAIKTAETGTHATLNLTCICNCLVVVGGVEQTGAGSTSKTWNQLKTDTCPTRG
jgi:hypothetical protein